jgi:Zn-dependent oligopeptidase
MTHDEVRTLFHEFGHVVHRLVGGHRAWFGMSSTHLERDFIEAPSQMLENWCRIPSCLAALSSHYRTGEPIPPDMLAGLVAAHRETKALDVLDQLGYASFDMAVHTFPMHEREPNYAELYGAVYREVTGVTSFDA